jgi:mono/diheme cytochrome c family protein
LGGIGLLLIAFTLTLGLYFHQISDPYVKEVLSLTGDSEQGYNIFQINCAVCHGIKADGSVGPSLHHVPQRKSRVGLIHQVISGKTPPMPKFQPTSQEMADLLSYLEHL